MRHPLTLLSGRNDPGYDMFGSGQDCPGHHLSARGQRAQSRLLACWQVITLKRPTTVAVLVSAVIVLVTSATIAFTLIDRSPPGKSAGSSATPAATRTDPGPARTGPGSSSPVVSVTLTDSGGPMGEGSGPMHPGAMGLRSDRATVPRGTVTFRVTNAGTVIHEMVILPLAPSQGVGTRPFDGEA